MISLDSPHARPMGRTRGKPNETKLTPVGAILNGSGHVHHPVAKRWGRVARHAAVNADAGARVAPLDALTRHAAAVARQCLASSRVTHVVHEAIGAGARAAPAPGRPQAKLVALPRALGALQRPALVGGWRWGRPNGGAAALLGHRKGHTLPCIVAPVLEARRIARRA